MRSPFLVTTLFVALACQPGAQGERDTTSRDDSLNPAGAGTGDTSGGIQADTGGVTLSLDKTAYAPGATAVMTIRSQRADTLGYNPCSNRSVEGQSPSGWVVHPEPNRVCTMELRLLLPGETQTAETDVPADLPAGTYRVVLRLRRERSDPAGPDITVTAVSAPFRVPAS